MKRLSYFILSTLILFSGCRTWNVDTQEELSKGRKESVLDIEEYWQKRESGEPKISAPEGWLQELQSDSLITLVNNGLEKNSSLKAAYYQVMVSRANQKIVNSERLPQIDFDFGASTLYGVELNSLGATISVEWEVDLWGRLSNALASADQEVLQSEYNEKYAKESLIGLIVKEWITVSEVKQWIQITEQRLKLSLSLQKTILEGFRVGQKKREDVELITGVIEAKRARLVQLERLYSLSLKRLKFSTGALPDAVISIPDTIESTQIPDNLPLRLLEQRYDILVAEAEIRRFQYGKKSARLERLPALNIGGSTGVSVLGNFIYSYQGIIETPIYRGGFISGNIAKEEALYQKALADYRSLVLQAAQDLQHLLSSQERLKEEAVLLKKSNVHYQKAYELREVEYKIGRVNLQDLLTLEDSWLFQTLQMVSREHSKIRERINYYLVLGRPALSEENVENQKEKKEEKKKESSDDLNSEKI